MSWGFEAAKNCSIAATRRVVRGVHVPIAEASMLVGASHRLRTVSKIRFALCNTLILSLDSPESLMSRRLWKAWSTPRSIWKGQITG